MKKIFIMGSMALFIACNNQSKESTSSSSSQVSTAVTNLDYPYPVNYTNAKMDDQKNTQTFLKLFKLWDDGDVEGQREYWADTAEVHTWDGVYIRGSRDSIITSGKMIRNALSSHTTSIVGTMSYTMTNNTTGKNENWASVWAKVIMTDKNAKTDSLLVHEGIKLNKDGKIEALYQFAAKISPLGK